MAAGNTFELILGKEEILKRFGKPLAAMFDKLFDKLNVPSTSEEVSVGASVNLTTDALSGVYLFIHSSDGRSFVIGCQAFYPGTEVAIGITLPPMGPNLTEEDLLTIQGALQQLEEDYKSACDHPSVFYKSIGYVESSVSTPLVWTTDLKLTSDLRPEYKIDPVAEIDAKSTAAEAAALEARLPQAVTVFRPKALTESLVGVGVGAAAAHGG